MFARVTTRKHDQRAKVDFGVFVRVLLLSEKVNELRHHLELKLALPSAAGTPRHVLERQHGIPVRPENGAVVPATQTQDLRVGALHHLVEVETYGVIFQTTAEGVSDVGVGEVSW